MKFLILFLFCEVLCELPVSTVLPIIEPETLTDLPRKTMELFDEKKIKSADNELELAVEVKAESTWPAQIIIYEETSDDELSNSSSTELALEESCTEENMEWNYCGKRCAQSCAFQPRGVRKTRAICESLLTSDGCYKGCFCKKDYVRLNDKCVLPINCPSEFQ